MEKNLYKILGVESNVSDDELKKVYKKLALQYHPDRQNGKTEEEKRIAEDKFKEISEAYSILSDPQKRKQYDMFGTIDNNSGSGGFDFDDIMNFMHSHGFNPFGRGSYTQTVKGSSIRVEVICSLEDIYNEVEKTINYKRQTKCTACDGYGSEDKQSTICPHCNGSGRIQQIHQQGNFTQISETVCPHCNGKGKIIKNPCKKCNGTGLATNKETIKVKLYKGVTINNIQVIQGKGNDAPNNMGESGDLHIVYKLDPNSKFTLMNDGFNLTIDIDINIIDCILGCKKEITCIDGSKTTITIPRFTKEGNHIIVKDKGLPHMYGNNKYGDLIVVIKHKMPNKLNNNEIELLNKLKKEKNFS